MPSFDAGHVEWGRQNPKQKSRAIGRSPGDHRVDAPRACAGKSEIEEDEAVEDRLATAVDAWPEPGRKMAEEIGNGHLARRNECRDPGKQAKRQENAKRNLKQCGDHQEHGQRIGHAGLRDRKVKQLHEAVLHEQEGGHDAQNAENTRGPSGHGFST